MRNLIENVLSMLAMFVLISVLIYSGLTFLAWMLIV